MLKKHLNTDEYYGYNLHQKLQKINQIKTFKNIIIKDNHKTT